MKKKQVTKSRLFTAKLPFEILETLKNLAEDESTNKTQIVIRAIQFYHEYRPRLGFDILESLVKLLQKFEKIFKSNDPDQPPNPPNPTNPNNPSMPTTPIPPPRRPPDAFGKVPPHFNR